MKKYSRVFLFGALILVLLMTGCAGEEGTATPFQPGEITSAPTIEETSAVGTAETQTTGTAETEATSTEAVTSEATQATTSTPMTSTTTTATTQASGGVPVTGGDINVLECQFCIGTMAYALLDIPAVATFNITNPASPDPDTQCNVVDTFQDRQVVFCRAEQNTSLTLDVCTDANTCSPVTVLLQKCPLAANTTQPSASKTRTPVTPTTAGTAVASPTGGTTATATPTP